MNSNQLAASAPPLPDEHDEINFREYFDILVDNRWLILFIAITCLLLGLAYAALARPVYESNLMIQVEDSEKSAGSFLGDAASSLFNVKTPAAGEIEIIRSRLILGQAVDNTKLYIDAAPNYVPVVGRWLSKRSESLSDPGFFGLEGYVSGTEKISVPQFDVPKSFESTKFILTVGSGGAFSIQHPNLSIELKGSIGTMIRTNVPNVGNFNVLVSSIEGLPGAQFVLTRYSKQVVLNALQDDIKVLEKGKQSGVIDVSWQSTDPIRLTQLLNEIGALYVRQNIERKSAEAEKTLGFLGNQLPQYKKQLEQSESVYNQYRNDQGTVSLDDEAKNALGQIVDLQSKLLEAQQKKRDLESRFTSKHPSMQALDSQIQALNSDISKVNTSIRKMPLLQQDAVRMQRDIKVNTDLYVSLLNSSLQMNLAKEGKVGNARLLDTATVPEQAIKPKKPTIIAAALFLGIVGGVLAAIARSSWFGGIRNPHEIEAHTGLNVYSTIPLSESQKLIEKDIQNKTKGVHVLFAMHPEDPAIESLRSLKTALQFAMLEAANNRVLISGGTPGVGKSFVSANFAAIIGASGKRVLLIDADLRKGYINQMFSRARSGGLSELISGSCTFDQAIHRDVQPNLDLITTGVLPPNPAELLMSESFSHVLDAASERYDLVIIDTAPVLVAADTAAVAPLAGTVLLVARAEKTQLGELVESTKRLAHVGAAVNGVILNALDLSKRHYGSYGYKYGAYRYAQYKYGTASD